MPFQMAMQFSRKTARAFENTFRVFHLQASRNIPGHLLVLQPKYFSRQKVPPTDFSLQGPSTSAFDLFFNASGLLGSGN